jgi:spore coat polysaccharide biosynthesis predicted glycosyltransferase SpsG
MHAICIEASHQRGLGHLFRAMHLARHLAARGAKPLILLNEDARALDVLRQAGLRHEIVPLKAPAAEWEAPLIRRHGVRVWINDRHSTDAAHAGRVKSAGIALATFDDRGSGAALADLHFAALWFDQPPPAGKAVFRGLDYLILDPAVLRFRRLRSAPGSIVVSLGGSDTYGATVKVVRCLKKAKRAATVVLGPSFAHDEALQAELTAAFTVRRAVPSLAREFSRHELAVTGGGITAFEAAAAGLPTIIVANEPFEVPPARHLESLGCARFAGFHAEIEEAPFAAELPLEAMSRAGMARVTGAGLDNVARALDAL